MDSTSPAFTATANQRADRRASWAARQSYGTVTQATDGGTYYALAYATLGGLVFVAAAGGIGPRVLFLEDQDGRTCGSFNTNTGEGLLDHDDATLPSRTRALGGRDALDAWLDLIGAVVSPLGVPEPSNVDADVVRALAYPEL